MTLNLTIPISEQMDFTPRIMVLGVGSGGTLGGGGSIGGAVSVATGGALEGGKYTVSLRGGAGGCARGAGRGAPPRPRPSAPGGPRR
jgi:hypothetical protein